MGGDLPSGPARAGCEAGSPDASLRRDLKALLIAVGELGYREAISADAAARVESKPPEFERYFANAEDAFAAAYEAGSECLCERLIAAAAAEPGWVQGLRGALVTLFELVIERQAIARALLVEVHAAAGRTSTKHKEVIERLSHALEGARRETESRHSFSPLTGALILGGIEWAVGDYLQRRDRDPEQLWAMLPDLMHFAVLPYRGEEAAWAAYDETRALIDARS